MLNPNQSKAITRIFLFFFGSFLCLDLFYDKRRGYALTMILLNLGMIVFGIMSVAWNAPLFYVITVVFLAIAISNRISDLFLYLRKFEQE